MSTDERYMASAYADGVLKLAPAPEESYILAVCERGFGKITPIDQFRIQKRGGKGVRLIEVTDRNGPVVSALMVTKRDEVLLQTKRGKTVRIPVSSIRETGRIAQGVKLMDVAEADAVSVACVLPSEDV